MKPSNQLLLNPDPERMADGIRLQHLGSTRSARKLATNHLRRKYRYGHLQSFRFYVSRMSILVRGTLLILLQHPSRTHTQQSLRSAAKGAVDTRSLWLDRVCASQESSELRLEIRMSRVFQADHEHQNPWQCLPLVLRRSRLAILCYRMERC